MYAIFGLLSSIISIILFIVVSSAIVAWLISFGILNINNKFISNIYFILQRLTKPMLKLIRSFIPLIGGIDISFVILILFFYFIKDLIEKDLPRYFGL